MTSSSHSDVLIVGAGPAGLSLAISLAQAGFTNIQFENGSDQNDNALVVRQDPNAGRPADPANTPVKLTTVGFGGGDNNGGGNNDGPFG